MSSHVVALGLLLFIGATATQNSSRPHIILFVVDDLGFTDVGYHGSEYATPNIDRLATTGVRLERYYVQPCCSPTRSTFMTGREVHHTGFYSVLHPGTHGHLPSSPTLAEKLKEAGYKTHMLGKWHLGYSTWNATPMGRGFSTHFGFFQGAQDYYAKTIATRPTKPGGFDFWDNHRPAYEYQGGYSLTQYMDRANKLILEHDKTQPLFLYYSHQSIHAPIMGLPEPLKTKYEARCSNSTHSLRFKYCSMVTYLDDTIGDFVKSLVDADMWNNTLMFFSTDNGGMPTVLGGIMPDQEKGAGCNYPLRAGKATLFEGGVRGIGFLQGGFLPQSSRGTVRDGLMHSSDVYSTLLSAAGVTSLPAIIDGVDQLAMITQGLQSARSSIVIAWLSASGSKNGTAVIEGDMKLINASAAPIDGYYTCADQKHHSAPPSGWIKDGFLLFNLTADPNEQHNLIDEMPEVAERLRRFLSEADSEAAPPLPTAEDPLAEQWQEAHNNTMGPWADDTTELQLVV